MTESSEIRLSDSQQENSSCGRRALSGFFLVGMLLSFLSAILPAWGYHLSTSFLLVGNYFLSLNLGVLAGARVGYPLVARKGVRFAFVLGCGLGTGGLWLLALTCPPAAPAWRILGLALIGAAAGLCDTGIFQTLAPMYERDRSATVNIAGVLLGSGCLLTCLLVAGTYYVYTVPSILFFLGLLPAFFLVWYQRTKFPAALAGREPSFRETIAEFRHPGAVLFTLLLFFQFGNEFSVACWLPLFVIQRLGLSPESALLMLAFYWLCLVVGRLAAQALLPRVSHGKLLMASVVSAMFGCFILTSTNNRFGAWSGVFFVGAGFAAILPLIIEKIGFRFPSYNPALFNGVVSLAVTGGLLASGSLGYWGELWGMGIVMILPFAGTVMVFLLLLLSWLEAKLSGRVAERAL